LPEARQRDAARSRERLLAAALDEFSAHGFAGGRVNTIAERAGLNPQLINYYFGGKEGLYRALEQRWLEQEAALADPTSSLEDLNDAYLQASFADPRMARLLLWAGLAEDATPEERLPGTLDAPDDVGDLRRRQAEGQIAAELDPAFVELALMGATLAPIALPSVVRRLTGLEPSDPLFQDRYADQLRRIVRRLGDAGSRSP
jgi:AcrR family transcriptional regulator